MRRWQRAIISALTLASLAGIIFALGLIFGVWDPGGSSGGSSGQGPSNVVTRERDGVRLKLSVDREKYGPGDPVKVSLTIENTNQAGVDYRGKSAQEAGLTLDVVTELANPQPLAQPTAEDISGTLAGGKSIQRDGQWDKTIDLKLTPVTAPPGKYSVTATFLMARQGFADLTNLGGSVSFQVEGTAFVQPPRDAMLAALKSDQVKAWASGRGDTLVCAYPPRTMFLNGAFSTASAAESFDFIYKQQTDNGDPICGIATDGNAWRLVLFSPKGGEPHRLTVYVALDQPVVQRVEEGGPTATPAATP
ncbi:MAG TPA: hypothetical protein VLS25_02965 [Dehalococcoidia bacterium]|nr:hypothetical protein [Dehalococcoidia bacterium]